ncbi:uncharacterized protein BX663DRAFT_427423, partial [Cokeromyces recurvatus]|uniref:uncharacterized protein n=1 Tax=Cokeromyces recurvatus TaxID=90255 RepID=UPI002220E4E4
MCNLTMKRVILQTLARNSPEDIETRYKRTDKWAVNLDMNYLEKNEFIDEADFNINMGSLFARSMRGT